MNTHFHFAAISERTTLLKSKIKESLASSNQPEVQNSREDVEAQSNHLLTIAFCGQNGAGKSTLIKALTGNDDVQISANVCTYNVTGYFWNGVTILDTPGIQAGHKEHDDITYKAIDRSDLLVFVITRQLFDPRIAEHFRELAFDRRKAKEMLLVVNKMSLSPGSADILKPGIEEVISPLRCQDLKTTFIDTKDWLDASTIDDANEQSELKELSNFPSFIEALNLFVSEKGMIGRLTTPVFAAKYVAEQGLALLQVDEPGGTQYLEILRRARGIITGSQKRLELKLNGLIDTTKQAILREGTNLAKDVYGGANEKELERSEQRVISEIQKLQETLKSDIESTIGKVLDDLNDELRHLKNDPFVIGVINQFGTASQSETPVLRDRANDKMKFGKISSLVQQLGNWLAAPAIGANGADQVILTAGGAAGSNLAKWTYATGKFFGVAFKPWGAVNIAKTIGNVGKVISVAGAVLSVFAQVFDEMQKAESEKKLVKARSEIVGGFTELANEVETLFRKQVDLFLKTYYMATIEKLDEDRNVLMSNTELRSGLALKLTGLIKDSDDLIQDIQQLSPTELVTPTR